MTPPMTHHPEPAREAGARRVRHKKRGTTYEVLGSAEAQISQGDALSRILSEGDKLTIYRSDTDGTLWCRFPDEFDDGRFEDIVSASASPAAGGLEAVRALSVEAIARAICKGRGLNPEVQNQGPARDGTVDGHWDINSPFGRPYDNRWHYGWRNQVAAAEAVLDAALASPAPAAGVEAVREADSLLERALFANLRAGRINAGASNVTTNDGRRASICFAVHEPGQMLSLRPVLAPPAATRGEPVAFDPLNGGCPHCKWLDTNLGRVLDQKCALHQKIEDMQSDSALDRGIIKEQADLIRRICEVIGADDDDDPVERAKERMDEIAELEASPPAPVESAQVKLPRLTDAMIKAACKAHYGSEEIDGIAMTSKGLDWNFRQAFKRMWSGVRASLATDAEG